MQLTGDAGLEVRLPVKAGPHVVGVDFVREEFEPEGLPQPMQLGRVISNDQVYMGYANVGSVDIGGPYSADGPAKRHSQPQSDLRLHAAVGFRRARMRLDDTFANGPAGVPQAGYQERHRHADAVLRSGSCGRRELRGRDSVRAGADDGGSGFPAAGVSRSRGFESGGGFESSSGFRRAAVDGFGARFASVFLPMEQHSGRPSADSRRAQRTQQAAEPR